MSGQQSLWLRFRQVGWAALVAMAIGGTSSAALAATHTFTTSQSEFAPGVRNQGWWAANPVHPNFDANDNYFVGTDGGPEVRNFFTFDLSSAVRCLDGCSHAQSQ
jgi:hypothetical protein